MTAQVALPPATETTPFATGDIIAGRYRMVARIGCGDGPAEVWKADDLTLAVPVALKLVRSATPAARTRLLREARLTRQVTHPSVCRVFDAGEADCTVFFSMELVEGEDLAVLLKRTGRLTSERVVRLAHQLCAGLEAAHTRGVAHRSLSLGNILLDRDGQVRITGFDLALGTREPLPRATRRADVHAIGAILFELVTGRPLPATGPLPSPLAPDVCPELEQAVLGAIGLAPEDRLATVPALAARLPRPVPTPAAVRRGPKARTPNLRWLADAAVVGVAGLRAALLLRGYDRRRDGAPEGARLRPAA